MDHEAFLPDYSIESKHLRKAAVTSSKLSFELPWQVDVDVFPTATAFTNWNTLTVNANCILNGTKDSSGAQNDEIYFYLLMGAGTWKFELLHTQSTDRGIYTVSLDASSIGTIDGYAAAPTYNVRSILSGAVVAVTKLVTLKLKMATKNGASTNYLGSIQTIQLRRTA